jgi:hypothetical protein
MNWAIGRGHIDVNPALGIPKPSPERIRERTPSLDEIVEIWRTAEVLGYPFGPAVKLLIVLPMRPQPCDLLFSTIGETPP